jgi:choline kinase
MSTYQAVILAAGLSKRLRPLTDTTPKCLLKIGEKNLLHRTLDNLTANGINDIVFVTGYRENMIKDYVNENFKGLDTHFITNSGYENNNNSYSLWLAREAIREDILLLDSDILFEEAIIKKLLDAEHHSCVAVNFTKELDEEQIKVIVDNQNKILHIGKEISIEESAGESIGIEKFSFSFLEDLFEILERKITVENNVNEFYEASFQEMIETKEERNSIFAVDVSEFRCIEIDTPSDYENAQKIII